MGTSQNAGSEHILFYGQIQIKEFTWENTDSLLMEEKMK